MINRERSAQRRSHNVHSKILAINVEAGFVWGGGVLVSCSGGKGCLGCGKLQRIWEADGDHCLTGEQKKHEEPSDS